LKPKYLKILGLNSFLEEQTVDFSKLTERGLFGIFGPTGSGKSTILDAITIALYGYIARETKEYINTDTNKLYVSYEFEMGNGSKRKRYRVERSIRRNKNGGINTDFARLCFLDDDGNVEKVIDKVSEIKGEIEKIIGLNSNDFIRTVVLPQGKFSEFLKLSGKDRRNMLERILGLQKYGKELYEKIKSAREEKEREKRSLEDELKGYGGVTEENLKLLKGELAQIMMEEERLKKEIKKLEKDYEKYSRIWELQKELNTYIDMEKKLSLKAKDMELKNKKLKKGKNALNVKPYIENLDKTLEDIRTNRKQLEILEKKIEELKEKRDKTEKQYKIVYERKERELPNLIERETNIKHAIDLKRDIDKLERERKKLAQKFKNYQKIINDTGEKIKNIKESKEKYEEEIKKIEERINSIKVSPEYRNKLNKAWDIEKKYRELKKGREEKLQYIDNLEKSTAENNKKMEDILEELEYEEKLLAKLEDELKRLSEEKPKDNNFILNRQMELEKLKLKLKEAVKDTENKKKLEEEISEIIKNRREMEVKLEGLKENLERKIKECEKVKEEINHLERINRASILSSQLKEGEPCPVCGSTCHPNLARAVDISVIKEKEELRDRLELDIKKLETLCNKLELQLNMNKEEEEKKREEIDDYAKKLEGIDISRLERELKDMEIEIEKLKTNLQKWEAESTEKKDELDKIKEKKGELEKQKAVYTDRIRNDNERAEELKAKLEEINKELNNVSELYKKAKEELKLDNIEEKLEEIRKNDIELEKLDKKLKGFRENIKKLDDEREKLEKKLNEADIERSKIEESGKEKRAVIDEYKEKIKKITKNKDPEIYLKEISKLIEEIKTQEEQLRKKLNEEEDRLNRLKEDRAGIEKTIKSLLPKAEDLKAELEKALQENELKDREEVMENLISKEELKILEDEIKKYEDEVKDVKNNISRIRKSLCGESIDEEDWIKLKEDRKNKKENYNKLLEELGKKKEKISEMEKNLKKVNELNEKIKKLQHVTDMLNEMFKLVSGNRFVDFVAVSHLRYLAKEASKRLMEITNKRYSLELDAECNFVICDNYNGGVRRDCNTLSGGETFLTSLALALALSTQIQLKGNTSIEFFFLDEGFGTLDSKLLDTVMTSLERLHKENLCVGIISHVEELKNRVPVKLVVTPAESGAHGSKIKIEYS